MREDVSNWVDSNHRRVGVVEPQILGGTERIRSAPVRENFGVKITYQKTNQPYLGAGEFSVEDWGVFNRTRVRRFLEE